MMFWVFTLFLITLSFVHVTDSKDFDGACFNLEDGLYHLGPCEEKALYCANGKATFRSCPSPLLFNPGTKFCEKMEEILKHFQPFTDDEHEALPSDSFAAVPIWSDSSDDSSSSSEEALPFVGDISRSSEQQQDSESTESFDNSLPFVGNFVDSSEEKENSPPSYSVFLSRFPRPVIRHKEKQESDKAPKAGGRPPIPVVNRNLLDNFFGKHVHKSRTSEFAPINSPSSSGHDTFKTNPSTKFRQSEFAPIGSPVKSGHDIFKLRPRRSLNMGIPTVVGKCVLNESVSLNQGVFPSVGCVAKEVPSGCRPFYIACVEGRQVQRFCPSGLFFNFEKESCEHWRMISRCVQIRGALPPKSVAPSAATGGRPSAVLPQRKESVAFPPSRFCSELADGFYRHPTNCSRIIQCFNNNIFEYPPCRLGLVFNERTGFCDYLQTSRC